MDRPYQVAWKAGDCIVHASTEREAKEIAVEHIRSLDIVSVKDVIHKMEEQKAVKLD